MVTAERNSAVPLALARALCKLLNSLMHALNLPSELWEEPYAN
jgi:hypothetical protein